MVLSNCSTLSEVLVPTDPIKLEDEERPIPDALLEKCQSVIKPLDIPKDAWDLMTGSEQLKALTTYLGDEVYAPFFRCAARQKAAVLWFEAELESRQ